MDLPKLQRVITLQPLCTSSLYPHLVLFLQALKMTRFGFLSLALLSLQAFVGTGFAAVSFPVRCISGIRVTLRAIQDELNSLT